MIVSHKICYLQISSKYSQSQLTVTCKNVTSNSSNKYTNVKIFNKRLSDQFHYTLIDS